ncbi:MAG: hypothetical protein HQL12_04390 [Candidatus Omnitrophica bacterium]|nr:hypothetical protein [Candidatus Omnitrophota bacterium]
MLTTVSVKRISLGVLMLALLAFPKLSYADWSVGVRLGDSGRHHEDRHFYGWHEHPHYGLHIGFLPEGSYTIWVGRDRYYYYDGLYYAYVGHGDYVLVNPPVGAFVSAIPSDFRPVVINGEVYYTDNGVYYILTKHHGYKVVPEPVVYAQPAQVIVTQPAQVVASQPVETVVTTPAPVVISAPATVVVEDVFPVNVPNNSGGYTSVAIKKSGNGYVGPQGEFYAKFPSVAQLKAMYGK